MSLTFGIHSICDLMMKLHRDADLLSEEVTSDRLFNFVLTGYSMIDWAKNDPTVPPSAKVGSEIDGLYKDQWLKICGDLATASKHFVLKERVPITATATSTSGYGMGRYGKGGFGVGEESISLKLNDGTCFQCTELIAGVLDTWKQFFMKHNVCPAENTTSTEK